MTLFIRRSTLLLASLSLTVLQGCQIPKEKQKSHTSYIIGDDNIKPLDDQTASATTQMVMNSAVLIVTTMKKTTFKYCSGVLTKGVADGGIQVLTNHHCFAQIGENGEVSRALDPDACNETNVYFGYTLSNSADAVKIPCLKNSLVTDPEGDIAMFHLETPPPIEATTLELWKDPIPEDERVAVVIHYPNHEIAEGTTALGLKSVIPTASITSDNCITKGMFPRASWGLEPRIRFVLRHTCDLIHGSSGSALVDAKTSKILGINWGGIKMQDPENPSTDNVATTSLYVQAFLNHTLDEYKASIMADRLANSRPRVVAGPAKAEVNGSAADTNDNTGKKSNPPSCGRISGINNLVPPYGMLALLLITIPLLRGFL
jgi:hypothetical protein